MNEKTCKECQYFLQHYALGDHKFYQVYCGHCTYASPRRKRPYTKACDHFAPGTADKDRFVTKEYLSKALLEYMLQLELLPEIPDAPLPKKRPKQ